MSYKGRDKGWGFPRVREVDKGIAVRHKLQVSGVSTPESAQGLPPGLTWLFLQVDLEVTVGTLLSSKTIQE